MERILRKRYPKIYIFLGDPFNKRFVEQAMDGIPYETRFDYATQCTMYKLKCAPLYGTKFLQKMGDILLESGLKMYCSNKESKKGIVFYDKAYKGIPNNVDADSYL